MQLQQFEPLEPKIVLAIGAHPDDMDFGAAGTLATFAEQGAAVHYLQITDGGSGSGDKSMTQAQIRDIRKAEQQVACDIIRGKGVTFLDYCDGCLENTLDLKRDLVRIIRDIKPDTVITMDPSMIYSAQYGIINHPDHRAAGQAALDAVYPLARDRLSFPEIAQAGFEPHNVSTVLLLNFDDANYYVDVTKSIDTRVKAAEAHKSQNGAAMAEFLLDRAREAGQKAGHQYAEGFIRIDIR